MFRALRSYQSSMVNISADGLKSICTGAAGYIIPGLGAGMALRGNLIWDPKVWQSLRQALPLWLGTQLLTTTPSIPPPQLLHPLNFSPSQLLFPHTASFPHSYSSHTQLLPPHSSAPSPMEPRTAIHLSPSLKADMALLIENDY